MDNFYPRSPCGERRPVIAEITEAQSISIHALLAESDGNSETQADPAKSISIHALLAESDSPPSITPAASRNFYPRSPCGERQPATGRNNQDNVFLSTLSLRRATSQQPGGTTRTTYFYPRSPCGERLKTSFLFRPPKKFLSTLSLRRATGAVLELQCILGNFYPRSPCGERLSLILTGFTGG